MHETKCGRVAIIGRPNVGKSTLLNALLGEKISITCRKPQTTRHQILGIKTTEDTQYLFMDTPGMHEKKGAALNRYMNRAAFAVIHDVDVILWLIEPKWTLAEDWILSRLESVTVPIVLAVNKVDLASDKNTLLPLMKHLAEMERFVAVLPISAKDPSHFPGLLKVLGSFLPLGPFQFDEDELTDKSVRFLVSEIIREKLMRFLGNELPYVTSVEMDQFIEKPHVVDITATIYVERASQKAIVIGEKGTKLKEIGTEARRDIEALVDQKVMLRLWVKVKENWRDDERALANLGYGV